jgi:PAS domain S-box-containing protein
MPKTACNVTIVNVSQPLVQASLVGEAIDQGPVLVFVADEDMNYVAVNQFACDVLGYSREELLSLKVTEVVSDADAADRYAAFVAATRESGRARLRRKDGTELEIDYRAAKTTVAAMPLYVSVALVSS